jgi:glyoxylase-like metal-dependent hydrolase (beta-lactamase superfamily II)
VRWGDVEIVPLSDGGFGLDGGAMFGTVPKPLWTRRTTADANNRIPLALRPLLIRTNGTTILVDAGIGDTMDAKAREIYAIDRADTLHASLARAGVSPGQIDIVIATHLHFDHVGGLTTAGPGAPVPVFRNARHVVRHGEWEDATHTHERNRASYRPDTFLPVQAAGLLDLVDGDGDIVPGVSVWRTGGHTMHHQVVRIEAAGRVAVFAADLMPTQAHVDLPWIMGYDLYPVDTLRYKKRFLQDAIAGEYVIFFEHDPQVAAGIIRHDGRRLAIEPVEV